MEEIEKYSGRYWSKLTDDQDFAKFLLDNYLDKILEPAEYEAVCQNYYQPYQKGIEAFRKIALGFQSEMLQKAKNEIRDKTRSKRALIFFIVWLVAVFIAIGITNFNCLVIMLISLSGGIGLCLFLPVKISEQAAKKYANKLLEEEKEALKAEIDSLREQMEKGAEGNDLENFDFRLVDLQPRLMFLEDYEAANID